MTKSFPTIRAILVAALCPVLAVAIAGCGSKKSEDKKEFPPSVTAADAKGTTATLPVSPPPVAEPEPLDVPIPEPVAVREMPTSYKGFIAEGKRLYGSGEHADALEMFIKAADGTNYAYPRIQMARSLLAMGMFETARTHAEEAVDLDAESTFAWNTLGRVELAAGDLEAAVSSFERATETDEHNSYAWNNLGLTLLEQERYEDAAEALESATSSGTPKAYMWNNLGMAYEHLNMIAEARASYRQAADLGSDKAEASMTRLEGVDSLVLPSGDAEVEAQESAQPADEPAAVDGEAADLNDGIVSEEEAELEDDMHGC